MNSINENLLKILYYSPSTTGSIKQLYEKLKNKGVTYAQVKNWVEQQETHQLFKKQKRTKHYFPIMADYKNEKLQIDLADFSDIAGYNNGVKYLFVAVDVFSRFAIVIPLTNKASDTILHTTKQILDETKPKLIISDHGSEYTNRQFKQLLKDYKVEIRYCDVGDHHKLGIVDSFIKTLRMKINKFLEMHQTNKYIHALKDIVQNYNESYNSGIKKAPIDVKHDDDDVFNLNFEKVVKAKQEETIFNIGDSVRYIVNPVTFQKRSLAKWSKTIHKIVSKNIHSYVLDNGQTKKYYELQLIKHSQALIKEHKEPTRKQVRKENKAKRNFEREELLQPEITKKRQTNPTKVLQQVYDEHKYR